MWRTIQNAFQHRGGGLSQLKTSAKSDQWNTFNTASLKAEEHRNNAARHRATAASATTLLASELIANATHQELLAAEQASIAGTACTIIWGIANLNFMVYPA